MTERDIFLNALEIEDLVARAQYLNSVCIGQPALRKWIDDLLDSHTSAGKFLETPVMEQMTEADLSLAFLEPSTVSNSLGRLDYYEVFEVIGRGSTGIVLKARDTKLQRTVAIKMLTPRLAKNEQARMQFEREAQAIAAVRDDHVVAIYAVNAEGPIPYFVMEFIHGVTLNTRIREPGSLTIKDSVRIGSQVAAGLAAAHAQGVVHRDIKPSNVLLENSTQRVKIIDFGLARATTTNEQNRTGYIVGTPQYMSPEQASGEATDFRTDLFSLGSLLYRMSAGSSPFSASNTAETLKRVCHETPSPVNTLNTAVPEWLSNIISKLMAKLPQDRYGSAQEVADLLHQHLAECEQDKHIQPSKETQGPRWHIPLLSLLVTLAIVSLAYSLYSKWWPHREELRESSDGPSLYDSAPPASLELPQDDIPKPLLNLAGSGDARNAPKELAAVLGNGKYLLPHVGKSGWLALSKDGQLLACPIENDVALFQTESGELLRYFKGPGGKACYAAISPDNQLLAVSTWYDTWNGAIRVWDLRSGKVVCTTRTPGPKVSASVVFSPDGKRLLTEGEACVHVLDSQTGQITQTVSVTPSGIATLCFSPNGCQLAVAQWYGKQVSLFNWEEDRLTATRTLPGHTKEVGGAVYSPDGKWLASCDVDNIILSDAVTLEERKRIAAKSDVRFITSDSRFLLFASTTLSDKPTHIFTRYSLDSGNEPEAFTVTVPGEPWAILPILCPKTNTMYFAKGKGATSVVAVDIRSGKELSPRYGHAASLNTVSINPEGSLLASAGEGPGILLWDVATRQIRQTIQTDASAISTLSFHPKRRILAFGTKEGHLILCDMHTGKEIRRCKGLSPALTSIAFSTDGESLAAGTDHGDLTIWNTTTGKEHATPTKHIGDVRCVSYSQNGELLATGGEDRVVRILNVRTQESQKYQMPRPVNHVSISPDNQFLAAVCDGREDNVYLWNLSTREEHQLKGHLSNVRGVAFSPAAALLATCGDDDTVRLWDLREKPLKARVIGPGPFGGSVRSVSFTPDGRYLATANVNGLVYMLRTDSISSVPDALRKSSETTP